MQNIVSVPNSPGKSSLDINGVLQILWNEYVLGEASVTSNLAKHIVELEGSSDLIVLWINLILEKLVEKKVFTQKDIDSIKNKIADEVNKVNSKEGISDSRSSKTTSGTRQETRGVSSRKTNNRSKNKESQV